MYLSKLRNAFPNCSSNRMKANLHIFIYFMLKRVPVYLKFSFAPSMLDIYMIYLVYLINFIYDLFGTYIWYIWHIWYIWYIWYVGRTIGVMIDPDWPSLLLSLCTAFSKVGAQTDFWTNLSHNHHQPGRYWDLSEIVKCICTNKKMYISKLNINFTDSFCQGFHTNSMENLSFSSLVFKGWQ